MSWVPNYDGEPYAFAQALSGPVPFTPHSPNQGELRGVGISGDSLSYTFESVLIPVPEPCLVESIKHVWVYGIRLTAADVSAPGGWLVRNVTGPVAWPGTCVMLTSPPHHRGRSLVMSLGSAAIRMVALMEWRGEPNRVVIIIENGGGGVG